MTIPHPVRPAGDLGVDALVLRLHQAGGGLQGELLGIGELADGDADAPVRRS